MGEGTLASLTGSDARTNTAIGHSALYSLTTGGANAAMGNEVLYSLTTGSYNTGLGREAGGSVTTGSNNVFLGYKAGLVRLVQTNFTSAHMTPQTVQNAI